MSSGFADHRARLKLRKQGIASKAYSALEAAMSPVLEASQGQVPVKEGVLKATGRLSIEISGSSGIATVSYGSGDTVTEWHGVGYEIFVHTPGTRYYGGVPYLEQPTLDEAPNMAKSMAKALKG